MTPLPLHSLAPRRALWFAALLTGTLLLGGLLLARATPCEAADAPTAAPDVPQVHRPGDEVVLARCLDLSVLDLLNRDGPLQPNDWVTLRVTNRCTEPVRYLLVDLVLVDVVGEVYGRPLWVLQRGEVLPPGASKTDRYPVPDDAHHVPSEWAVRLRYVETPGHRYYYGPWGHTRPAALRGR